MSHKKGFTLVELLVVIAIIALLLSILMPALGKVRRQAERTICASQLHSWGTALAVYSVDNSNYFPYNGVAIPPNIPVASFNLNWCGTVVQNFWKNYLLKADNAILKGKKNILYCPTLKSAASTYNDQVVSQGQAGYFLLPNGDNRAPYQLDYTGGKTNPDGVGWRTRQKYGSVYRRGPVAGDLAVEFPQLKTWGGAHMNGASGQSGPPGVNILFEDNRVDWIKHTKTSLGVGCIYSYNLLEHYYYNPVVMTAKIRTAN
jgi:prepilin-type N-terminal cleavage/methylation domain-containing protein